MYHASNLKGRGKEEKKETILPREARTRVQPLFSIERGNSEKTKEKSNNEGLGIRILRLMKT